MKFSDAIPLLILENKKLVCDLWNQPGDDFNHYLTWDSLRKSYSKHYVFITHYQRGEWFSREGHPATRYVLSEKEMEADWEVVE